MGSKNIVFLSPFRLRTILQCLRQRLAHLDRAARHRASIEDYNYQMANLSKDETNLPMVIWIESNTRTCQHDIPRLKFANSYSNKQREIDLIPISIAHNPEILIKNSQLYISQSDLNILIEWIKRHYDDLIKVWNQDITPTQFVIKINEQ